jgi:hypothetical protein
MKMSEGKRPPFLACKYYDGILSSRPCTIIILKSIFRAEPYPAASFGEGFMVQDLYAVPLSPTSTEGKDENQWHSKRK